MKHRNVLPAVLGVASLFATPAIFASPLHLTAPVHAMFSHEKMISFSVRNSSTEAIELKAGDKIQTVAAGKTISLKLPEGTRVTANKTSGSYTEGAVIAEVQSPLSGNTIVLH